jgi:hypothetical protein
MTGAVLAIGMTLAQLPGAPTLLQARAATYAGVSATPVTLVDGRYEEKAPAAGRARLLVSLGETPLVTGYLDRDGRPEGIVTVWTEEPGRDRRLFLAVLVVTPQGVRNVATAPIGDRVQVRAIRLEENRILVETLTSGRRDRAGRPTVRTQRMWAFADGALMEAESIARNPATLAR